MSIYKYKSQGYKTFDLRDSGFDEVWNAALYNELYPNYRSFYKEITDLLKQNNISKQSRILDSCVGSGFLTKDLLLDGYDIDLVDKNPSFGEAFISEVNKKLQLKKYILQAQWSDYQDHPSMKPNTYDWIFNRGNSFIYASGGINQEFSADSQLAKRRFIQSLEGLYYVLKPGGVLLLDKYKDEELPFECHVGFDTNSQKDIVWYCHRKPDLSYREASIGLESDDDVYMHYCDDLSESLLFECASLVGFKIEKIHLNFEKNFAVYLLTK